MTTKKITIDTTIYSSDALPTWFGVLRPIIETDNFASMTITFQDRSGPFHYKIAVVEETTDEQAPPREQPPTAFRTTELMDALASIDASYQLLAMQVKSVGEELATLNQKVDLLINQAPGKQEC